MTQPPAGRAIARIVKATMFPTREGEPVEIPGAEIANAGIEGGHMIVVQSLPDGRIVRWVDVPCRLEHERPSGLVAPGVRS